ncbi:MAG: hypothetical protein JSV98_02565 [candidate division WOR-3 bacterium]|nr:MAG: hypothetical protein JSV98_02565 [candidate division WOR-3 bacterium]
MTHFLRISVAMFFLVICVVVIGSAENDMSLPDPSFRADKALRVAGVRDQTPPLINVFPAPDSAMRGLAYDGQFLWAANSGDGNSLYGAKIYKLLPDSGIAIDTFNAITDYSCGLAWDGEYLWYSEYISGYIYQLDTSTMTPAKSFPAPTTHPFDLAWDGAYLYAVKGNQPYISVIDTSSGMEIDSITATYSSPNIRPFGLTFLPRGAPQLLTCDGNYGSNLVNSWSFYTSAWVEQWASDPLSYPSGLAHDSVTERLWVSCYERDSIYVYDVSQVGITSTGQVTVEPCGIEVYPNPFHRLTDIRYRMTADSHAKTAKVYAVSGRLMRDLSDQISVIGEQLSVTWDGADDAGRQLPAGVYFLRVPIFSGAVKLVKLSK